MAGTPINLPTLTFTDYHPFLADGDIAGWVKTLDTLQAMAVDKIVPEHGPLSGKQDLTAMKEYLLLCDRKARELAAASSDAEAIATQLQQILPPRAMAALSRFSILFGDLRPAC